MRKFAYGDHYLSPYAYRETPYTNVQGSLKFRIWGDPVRKMNLFPYGDQHIHFLPMKKKLRAATHMVQKIKKC